MDKRNVLITEDSLGKKIVVLPHIIFKGKRGISWQDVERYLIQYAGEIVENTENRDIIYIGKDFADEFSNSEYTRSLKGTAAKAKANMTQGIPEIIEIATQKRWSADYNEKHGNKAANGWYRYNTRFALPVCNDTGEIVRYNIFQAVLIVRYASDNRLYLYDIQGIKKETSNPS